MENIQEKDIETELEKLECEKIPWAKEQYLSLQCKMVDTQGFVSMKLQNQVELAKNEYFSLLERLNELRQMLTMINGAEHE